ncbi:MAG: hypothetical protein RLZZ234_884 [Candidatus Parcubacteria bacterium]|jgi:hypothetical protein
MFLVPALLLLLLAVLGPFLRVAITNWYYVPKWNEAVARGELPSFGDAMAMFRSSTPHWAKVVTTMMVLSLPLAIVTSYALIHFVPLIQGVLVAIDPSVASITCLDEMCDAVRMNPFIFVLTLALPVALMIVACIAGVSLAHRRWER